jgi:HK97 family phage major capsid protein/HK97 family phage prohead protease
MTDRDRGDFPRDDLVRAIHPGFEIRASDNANGMPTLVSRFIQYDTFTEIDSVFEGHFMERIAHGALKKTLAENRDQIKVLLEHGTDPTVGKKPLGAIKEIRDEDGHAVGIVPLLDTSYVRDLVPALKERLYGSSFRFKVIKEDVVRSPARSEANPQGLPERTISELRLYEFGPVLFPAYAGATAGVRSLTDRFANTADSSEAAASRDNRLLQRSWDYVMDGIWAMHPSALATVLAIMGERRQGYRPTAEEIAERIGARSEPDAEAPPGIAVIQISGPIVPHATMMSDLSGAASIADLQTQFRDALSSADVAAILFNIDSPGGSVDLVPEFAAEILAARGKKPIVALANTFAASAAYWIASATDEIVVSPSAEVGSIGVWTAHEDISAAEEKLGVKTTLVSAGKYKVEGNPYEPLSEAAQTEMQAKVDAYYQMFVDAVARGRDTTSEAVRSGYGEGRTLMAAAAVKAGMADRVATYEQTIARLEKQTASTGRAASAAKTEAAATGTSAKKEPGHSAQSRSTPEPDKTHTKSEHKEKTTMEHEYRSVEEIDVRLTEIETSQNEMSAEWGVRAFDSATQTTWDELIEEKDQLSRDRSAYLDRKAYLEKQAKVERNTERGAGHPAVQANRNSAPENVFDLTEYHTRSTSQDHMSRLLEDGAKRAVDGFRYPNPAVNQADTSEVVERLLAQDGPDKEVAQRLLIHGSPTYRSAFWKKLSGQPLNAEEQRVMAQGMQLEARALTVSATGGVTVPVQIDPTVLLSSTGAINPFRQVSKQVQTTSYQWQGVTSTGITAQYRAEGVAMTDNSPTLVAPTINPERADAFVPFSWEAGQDWGGLEADMAMMFADAKDVLEATKFASGAGHASNEPQGVLIGAGTVVGSSATTTVGTVDIYALEAALPVRFQPNAVWLATPALFSRIRSQAALGSNSGGIWADSLQVGQPARLLGYPAYKASSVGTAGNLAVSVASTKWGIFGDFSKFAIVDRIGMQVKYVDTLFNGNTAGGIAYPNGQSGIVLYWRNSSGVLTSNAFRVGTVT